MSCALTRFVDHFLGVGIALRHDLLITLLRVGELLSNLLGVQLSFFNFSPSILENGEDRFLSEAAQKKCDDAKADHLREKQFPIPAKRVGGLGQDVGSASRPGRQDPSPQPKFWRTPAV